MLTFKYKHTIVWKISSAFIKAVYNKQQPLNVKIRANTKAKCLLTLSQAIPGFYMSAVQVFCKKKKKKTVGKREIAHNEQFLHFPQCFLRFWRTFRHFH